MENLIYTLIIGAACGWLAGLIRQGYGFGLWGNMVVGILGGFLGTWLFDQLDIRPASGLTGQIITAVVGALVLLFLIGLARKNK